jgi:hypothetical protein
MDDRKEAAVQWVSTDARFNQLSRSNVLRTNCIFQGASVTSTYVNKKGVLWARLATVFTRSQCDERQYRPHLDIVCTERQYRIAIPGNN